ncbi:MAG: FliM/FliN family flagellar motor switch protein [Armatimonadota bacterium]
MNLSPEEMEEFSQAMKNADGNASAKRVKQVRAYDFAHPDKLSKVHLRVIQSMMSSLERTWASTLTSVLKDETVVTLDSVEQVTFESCVESFPSGSIITALTMKPLSGATYLQMSAASGLGFISRMAGGRTQSIREPRELTMIEQRILQKLLDRLAEDLQSAWKPLIDLDVAISKIHSSAEDIEILPEEMMLAVGFTWNTGPLEHKIVIIMPTSSIDLVRDLLTPEQWLRGKPSEDQKQQAATPSALIKDVSVQTVVELGKAKVSMQDIIGIDVGDVIRLDKSVDELLDVKVQGETKFCGRPGLIGTKLAVQISERTTDADSESERGPAASADALDA